MRRHLFFLAVWLTALLVQVQTWHVLGVVDERGWMRRIAALAAGDWEIFDYPQYANPGMAMVTVGGVGHRLGAPLPVSLVGSVSLFVSLAVAAITTTVHALFGRTDWALAVGGLVLLHRTYASATPHDAIITPLLVLLVLLVLLWLENPVWRQTRLLPVAIGVAVGVALATHITLALLFVSWAAVALSPAVGRRSWYRMATGAGLALAIFNIPFFITPLPYIRAIAEFSLIMLAWGDHPLHKATSLAAADMFPLALLSVAGAVFAAVSVIWQKVAIVAPRHFMAKIIVLTGIITAIIFSSAAPSQRYFHALLMIWEVFLLLTIMRVLSSLPLRQPLRIAVTMLPITFIAGTSFLLPELFLLFGGRR